MVNGDDDVDLTRLKKLLKDNTDGITKAATDLGKAAKALEAAAKNMGKSKPGDPDGSLIGPTPPAGGTGKPPSTPDFSRLFEQAASFTRPEGLEGEDPFRLTGSELYNPQIVITRAIEKMFGEQFARATQQNAEIHIDEALKLARTAIEEGVMDSFREKFGTEGEAKTAFDKWKNDTDAQQKVQNKLDDERVLRVNRHQNRFLFLFGDLFRVPLAKFTSYLIGVIGKAGEQQKAALKFNKTFSDAISSAGNKINEMPGNLQQKMETLFEFEAEGLEQVGKNTLNLAARMKITGQNQQGLIKLQKKLLNQGGLSLGKFDQLSLTIDTLSKGYTMTADLLIDSISQLDQSLSLLMVGGATAAVADALAGATKMFPSLSKELGEFADAFATADIGQLQILGGTFEDLERFASGQIRTGEDYLKIVHKIGDAANRFVAGQDLMGRKAMLEVVGPLGVAAMMLQENMASFGEQMDSVENTASRIFSNFEIAMNEILAPLEESITQVVTFFQGLASVLVSYDNAVKDFMGGFFRLHHFIGIALVSTIAYKVLPALDALATGSLIAAAHGKRRDAALLGMGLRSAPGAGALGFGRVLAAGFMRLLMGPLGIGLLIYGIIKFLSSFGGDEKDREAEKETADNTRRLVEIAKDRERADFGASRFERLTQKLIQDSLFAQAAQESVLNRSMSELIEYTRLTSVNTGTPTVFETSVPTRTD